MRAIQMTEFGGPEVLKLAELPTPEPGPGEVLIRVTRAGLNFADTHTRTNSYVRKATLPLVPGGEVAGVREDTGERVVALVGDGGYAEYAIAPRELVFPIPDELDDGTALAMIIQGLTAWHLYRTAGARGRGRERRRALGRRRRRLARRAARPPARRRARDRDGLERRQARAGARARRRRGDRPRARGPDRAADRGQRGPRASTSSSRWPAARCSTPPTRRSRRSGGSSSTGSPRRSPTRSRTGSLLRHSRAVVGFYLFHCLERPGMFADALADLFARAARGELRTVIGGTYPLEAGRPGADRPARAAHDGQAAARPRRMMRKLHSSCNGQVLRRSRSLRVHTARARRRRLRVAQPDPGAGDPVAAGGPRRDRPGADGHRQDGRLRAADHGVRRPVRAARCRRSC